ncbi:MAG: alanine/glycine:cation symporter family protein [Fusobacteriaceae bacterium]
MEAFFTAISDLVWSNYLVYLCLAAGLFFTIVTRFTQVTMLKEMVKLMFESKDSKEGVSSFNALCMAVSGRVGTGNIAGVATAIAFGGPGSIFWLWVIAILGAASSFIESTLGQLYKEKIEGGYRGGPQYYFSRGLFGGKKWYGSLFSVATLLAAGIFAPGVQANAIASAMKNAFELPTWGTGIIIIIVLALIIFGGVKRIGNFAGVVVPFMAIVYILVAIIILILNYSQIIPAFALIFKSAFGGEAAFGAMLGSAIAWGVKRGVYSNEAGQGTGPLSAAAAEVTHPVKQGLVQSFSIYIDSIFICTATALMILLTGAYKVFDGAKNIIFEGHGATAEMLADNVGPLNTSIAISETIPGTGGYIVAIAMLFFAFTTILAYFWQGDSSLVYFSFGRFKPIQFIHKAIFLAVTFYGTITTGGFAWTLGDIGVGIMAWVNIVGILLMYKPALICLKDYKQRMKEGRCDDDDFDPEALGIPNTSGVWGRKNKSKK